jgi:hypothetical protein
VALQQPPEDVDVPVFEDTPEPPEDVDVPVVEDTPVVGHGTVLAPVEPAEVDISSEQHETEDDGLGIVIGTSGGGLSPPAPSSVAPSGIPTRPTVDRAARLGDEADAAGLDAAVLLVAQVPDAVPAVPPPSNKVVDAEVPEVDVAVPTDVAGVELAAPKDASGIDPPMPMQAVWPAVRPIDDAPAAVGLRPGDESSKPPSGIPVGATGAPGPMPSGEVMPSGGVAGLMPTWANTELEPK